MVELPLKKYSENCSSNQYNCLLKSNDLADEKVLKRIANENFCTKFLRYKDCYEHVMKYHLMFKKNQDKVAFIKALSECSDIQLCPKLRKYA